MTHRAFFHAPLIVVAAALACGPLAPPTNIHEGETLEAAATWSGTHLVQDSLFVKAPLTLEACAKVQVEPGGKIWVEDGGSIVAQGTADCPVVFTSSKLGPAAGDWAGIEIYGTASSNNAFDHTVFEYGGDNAGIVWLESGARAAFRNVTVRHTQAQGFDFYGDAELAAFEGVTFEDIGTHPITLGSELVSKLGAMTVTSAGTNTILVSGHVKTAGAWRNHGVPYQIDELFIEARVDVEAGTRLLVNPGLVLFVADGGALYTNGTEAAPVIIESSKPGPSAGDWYYVEISGTASPSTWTWTTLRHAGADGYGAVWLENGAELTLDHVTFEEIGNCHISGDGTVTTVATTYDACP